MVINLLINVIKIKHYIYILWCIYLLFPDIIWQIYYLYTIICKFVSFKMASFSLKKNKVMLLPRHFAEPQTEKKNKIITQDKNAQELINSVQIKTLHNSASLAFRIERCQHLMIIKFLFCFICSYYSYMISFIQSDSNLPSSRRSNSLPGRTVSRPSIDFQEWLW